MAYENPIRKESCKQNSATAITKGMAVVMNDTADCQNVVASGSLTAKMRGVALEDSPGQSTASKPMPFPVVTLGPCKAKVGAAGTATQGLYAVSDANGGFTNATATGAAVNVYGRWLESGVAGDYCTLDVDPRPTFV